MEALLAGAPASVQKKFTRIQLCHGKKLVHMGQTGGPVYVLLQGMCKVSAVGPSGSLMAVTIYRPWDLIGEAEVVDDTPALCDITALGDCELLVMDRDTFFSWMQLDFEFAKYLVGSLAQKLGYFTENAVTQVTLPLRDRLYCLVQEQCGADGVLRFEKQLLAEQLGTSLRSLNRTIKELVAEGRLCYRGGLLVLPPAERPRAVSR